MNKELQQQRQKYSVLYWIKRNNKVHKSKGVSKMDGILTIENAPSNLVSLEGDPLDSCSSSNDNNEEENNDDMNSKQNWRQSNQPRNWSKNPRHRFKKQVNYGKDSSSISYNSTTTNNASIVYTAVLPNLVQQAFQSNHQENGFEMDVILDISKWQIQIISKLDSNATICSTTAASSSNSSAGAISSHTTTVGSTSLKRSFASKCASHALNQNTIPLVQRKLMNPTTIRANIPFQERKPPVQPKPKVKPSPSNDASHEIFHNLPDTNATVISSTSSINAKVTKNPNRLSALSRKYPIPNSASSVLSSSSKDRIIQRHNHTLPSQKRFKSSIPVVTHDPSSNDTKDDFFLGAIGNIHVPMSIKQILKPHQISGVVFLWNTITGSCPKLRKVLDDAKRSNTNEDNYDTTLQSNTNRRGAILADEMGLGKTLMTITTIVSLHRRNRSDRFVVICPSSLVANWAQEFDKFLGKASQPHRVIIRKGGEEGLQKLKSFVQMKHASEGTQICAFLSLQRLFFSHLKVTNTIVM
jgi:SNF2 family DNA or RNA helicase